MCNCCYSHKCCNYLQSVKKALKGNTLVHLIDSRNVIAFYCHEGIYARE